MPAEDDTDLEPLLNAQQAQLGLVMNESAGIDNRALALLATVVAILLFMAQADLQLGRWWHGVLIFGPYSLALVCIGFAIWPRHYLGASPDIEKYPENLYLSRDKLLLQLLANTSEAIKHNNWLNFVRWRWCAAAIMLLLVGASGLFAIL